MKTFDLLIFLGGQGLVQPKDHLQIEKCRGRGSKGKSKNAGEFQDQTFERVDGDMAISSNLDKGEFQDQARDRVEVWWGKVRLPASCFDSNLTA